MKSTFWMPFLLIAMAFSGCLADDTPADEETTDLAPTRVELEPLTFSDGGMLLVSDPAVGSLTGASCNGVPMAFAEHEWELPETVDGIAVSVGEIRVDVSWALPTSLDMDIRLFGPSGAVLAATTAFEAGGNSDSVVATGEGPGTYVIEVSNCAGAASTYNIDASAAVSAMMAAAGSNDGVANDQPPEEPTGTSGDGYERGEVQTRQEGDRWVAERIDTYTADLDADSGSISLESGAGFLMIEEGGSGYGLAANLQGRGQTEQEARDNLARIMVDHEISGASTAAIDVRAYPSSGQWQDITASFYMSVPSGMAWTTVDADTSAGAVDIQDLIVETLRADTSAGAISISGVTAGDMDLDTSAGAIQANMNAPTRSGSWSLDTSAGAIDLLVDETSSVGYDVSADTSAGSVTFHFSDAPTTSEDCQYASCSKTARTSDYDDRDVKTRVDLDTSAGSIEAGS